ncbi:hypothetical protein CAI21_08350 [Alkalilimnicola ehrlichii]|uniref:tRNA uridine(34) hydroxylase n=1 Tax=Alkalilimnicola ehrlichii TaxID=351052 RepID=A0A3E0WWP8_9GAMM|nr:rhodanese-related sulfurtransferase [Alkalilimnicola ehrlichii]RFA29837.1 hypothetical protein CAI21_08350 [Alkalilimnicola ehrlichii]RFA36425.1 hypothetical protein CAL65_10620 [Alkalilimnicola ehrlichii]
MSAIVIATFYKFVPLDDCQELQTRLQAHCEAISLRGTILLAHEGINATVAGNRSAVDSVLSWLRGDARFADLAHKESTASEIPFQRMKVRVKKEIVTLGQPEADPVHRVGTYVKPRDWNALIQDPDVVVIDTRNDYEVAIGSFEGAIDPGTEKFRDFPAYIEENLDKRRHKRVAMFCTGGIRCEKSTSYLLNQGFEEVYHLEGGILKYLEEVPEENSLWRGECFVFDERVAVKHGLALGSYDACRGCGRPISEADKAAATYEEGVCCPHCHATLAKEQRERLREAHKQRLLARRRQKAQPA